MLFCTLICAAKDMTFKPILPKNGFTFELFYKKERQKSSQLPDAMNPNL